MANDIKSGVGYIIPAAGVVGFFTALFMGQPILSIIIAIAGILVWFIYMLIMESSPPSPSQLGNLIIFFWYFTYNRHLYCFWCGQKYVRGLHI